MIYLKKGIYTLSTLLGLIISVWGYETYLLTFIDVWPLVTIALVSTVMTLFLIKRDYLKLYKIDNIYMPFLQSMLSSGLIITSGFVVSNYTLSDSYKSIEVYEIIEAGNLAGKNRKPYALIERNNQIKKIVFKQNPIINSKEDKVELSVKKGLFGYDVIVSQRLVNSD